MEHCEVLIADDNVRARWGLCALLALWPEIEVVGEAGDGHEVLEMVRERQPDVILMDIRMPLLDGLEVTRQIKEHWPKIRIILTSMAASHRAEALAAGADGFVAKGGSIEDLRAAILQRASLDR